MVFKHGLRVALILAGLTAALSLNSAAAQSPARTRRAPQSPSATDPAAVERVLLDATRRTPDSFEAHHRLAGFYLQQGKLPAAIPHLQRAQQIDPSHYAVGYDLAVALIETDRLNEARAQVQRLLTMKDAGEVYNLVGDVEERAGNRVAAAELYQRAAHMDPSEEHLFDWGNNLLQMRALEPATDVFTAAIKRHPRSARLHVGLGIAHYSRGNYFDAVKSFCDAADLAPSDPRPYEFLGEMYGVSPELGHEVTVRLSRFVRTHPRSPLAHFQYAMSLWKTDAAVPPDKARQVEALLRKAVLLDPKMAKGYLQLGILLSDQQRYEEAVVELRRATRLQPDLAQAHYRLAQVYQRTGQRDLAAKELDIFRRLSEASRGAR